MKPTTNPLIPMWNIHRSHERCIAAQLEIKPMPKPKPTVCMRMYALCTVLCKSSLLAPALMRETNGNVKFGRMFQAVTIIHTYRALVFLFTLYWISFSTTICQFHALHMLISADNFSGNGGFDGTFQTVEQKAKFKLWTNICYIHPDSQLSVKLHILLATNFSCGFSYFMPVEFCMNFSFFFLWN